MTEDATQPTTDDRSAFTALLERHRGIVRKVASTYAAQPHEREELAQEIAAQLWRAWPRYDPARSGSTWLYRVALNVAISHLREEQRRRRHLVPLDPALHDGTAEGPLEADTADALRVLHGFVATLPPLERALLLLYLDGCSTREIADVLGLGASNVTTRLSRLRQRLRAFADGAHPDRCRRS